MKLIFALLFVIILCSLGTPAQATFDGRTLDNIKSDYQAVGAVIHVKIKKITLAAPDALPLYAVQSEVIEVFKGKVQKMKNFTFYFSAEEGYNAQPLVGKEWIIFLEKRGPVPPGGTGWYELENSTIPASPKLSLQLRKLRVTSKKS